MTAEEEFKAAVATVRRLAQTSKDGTAGAVYQVLDYLLDAVLELNIRLDKQNT